MVAYTSNETRGLRDQPVNLIGDPSYGGTERRFRSTIRLNALSVNSSTSATTAGIAIGDDFLLCDLPPGYRYVGIEIVSSVTLGATTINIGRTQVHATNTFIATGLTYTTPNVPITIASAASRALTSLPPGRYYATFGTEVEPASANDIVIDFIVAGP